MKEAIGIVEAAQKRGLEIAADQYPYVASSTGLSQTIPPWAHEGGGAKLADRLKDPATRAKIRKEMDDPHPTWENRLHLRGHVAQRAARVDRAGRVQEYEGMRVDDAAKAAGQDPYDFVFALLIAARGNVGCVWYIIDEADLKLAMQQPWVSVGSDGSALATSGPLRAGVPHPRNFGTFPRVLGNYVREEHVITLEQAVHKMTGLTASQLHFKDRGRHQERICGRPRHLRSGDGRRPRDLHRPVPISDRHRHRHRQRQVVLDHGRHTGERPGRRHLRTRRDEDRRAAWTSPAYVRFDVGRAFCAAAESHEGQGRDRSGAPLEVDVRIEAISRPAWRRLHRPAYVFCRTAARRANGASIGFRRAHGCLPLRRPVMRRTRSFCRSTCWCRPARVSSGIAPSWQPVLKPTRVSDREAGDWLQRRNRRRDRRRHGSRHRHRGPRPTYSRRDHARRCRPNLFAC